MSARNRRTLTSRLSGWILPSRHLPIVLLGLWWIVWLVYTTHFLQTLIAIRVASLDQLEGITYFESGKPMVSATKDQISNGGGTLTDGWTVDSVTPMRSEDAPTPFQFDKTIPRLVKTSYSGGKVPGNQQPLPPLAQNRAKNPMKKQPRSDDRTEMEADEKKQDMPPRSNTDHNQEASEQNKNAAAVKEEDKQIPSGYEIFKREQFRYENEDNIPVFYNLFIKDKSDYARVKKLVEEQFSKLLSIHKPIYINNIGVPLDFNEGDEIHKPLNTTRNHVELLGVYETASELVTLKHLWDYCQASENRDQKIAYLHSKGSYTPTIENGKLRRFLTAGTLSVECATMPQDTCNICSSRFSPVPHPHTSGNMWLARCDYIQKLKNPEIFEQAMDSLGYTGGERYLACDGRGRYSAEHWVLSHPASKPCDLFENKQFTWNYDGVPTVQEFRHHLKLAKFPRFSLETYLKTKIHVCPFRGASLSFRINEYKGLYDMEPPDDWWGHGFFKEDDEWWPYRDTTWVELPEFARQEIIKMGYNHYLWDNQQRPYLLWARSWDSLTAEQQTVLGEIFTFDEKLWNTQVRKELRDAKRIRDSARFFEPNTSFDRCNVTKESRQDIKPWYLRKEETKEKPLRDYVFEYPSKPANKKRLLVIASVPRDETHLLSLWTELECFADPVDHVLIAAPEWGKVYVEHVMKLAKTYIPHFVTGSVTLEAKFFLNNRYDVGLWCDAINSLDSNNNNSISEIYDEYGLVNDSVFALRKFSAIFDNLQHQNLHMTSLAYSFTHKWNTGVGPEAYWVESVFRAFDPKGMGIFRKHSCVPEDDPKFCPEEKDNKACIINNFEHDLAAEYPCHKVQGLFPTEPPDLLKTRELWKLTWIKNTRYWRMLVDRMGFPIAKVNEPKMSGGWYQLRESVVAWPHNPLLHTCTKHILHRLNELFEGMDFGMAKPFYKQRWEQLPPDLQSMANQTLGYGKGSWDLGKESAELAGKPWDELTPPQQQALLRLECSRLMYHKNVCSMPRN